ncbi:MAG: hypothetical protein V1688_02780 [bacterium]
MNEQNLSQSNESIQSSKHIWITIIAVVLTVIIVGGGIYAWQQSSLQAMEQSFKQQISDLQNQVEELQKTQSGNNEGIMNAPQDDNSKETTAQKPPLPTTCIDQQEGTPIITSISSYSGRVGAKIEIRGCNFAGFEGDLEAWVENDQGAKGLLYADEGSTAKLLKLTLKSPLCQERTSYSGLPCNNWLNLVPGEYKIYTAPWGKESNKVEFNIIN